MRIVGQGSRRIARYIYEPKASGGMLMERVQSQMRPIRRKRELLIINNRIETADPGPISCVPVQPVERGSFGCAIDKDAVLRSSEFRSSKVSWRSSHIVGQQQR